MSWTVEVGLGSLGAGGAEVLGAVVSVPGAHPASATKSATAIQPCFIMATVYREIAVTAVLAVTTGPSFSRSAPGLLAPPTRRPRRDLPPIPQSSATVLGDWRGEVSLSRELVGALLAHAEKFGYLDYSGGGLRHLSHLSLADRLHQDQTCW